MKHMIIKNELSENKRLELVSNFYFNRGYRLHVYYACVIQKLNKQ